MRVLLVVNASASSVTARRVVVVRRTFAQIAEVEVAETNRRGHATRLAGGAAHRGFDAVVVLGGDGTLNEVATGLAGSDCALVCLPGGSTNVFARTLGLPDDPVEAAGRLVAPLADGRIRRVGLGSVNGRYFCFHTGLGWDAALVERVERHAELKRYFGHPLFVWAGLTTFFGGYDRSRPHLRLTFEDGSTVEDGCFSVVLNSNPYTFVGSRPFNLCTHATLSRGLAVVTLRTMQAGPFLRSMARALSAPEGLTTNEWVDVRTDQMSLTIQALDDPVPYQVDGDHLGGLSRFEFQHHPGVLPLVVPEGFEET